jgi:hypothetical protein
VLTIAKQYEDYVEKDYLRLTHAALLYVIQELGQLKEINQTILELIGSDLPHYKRQQLLNYISGLEPIPAIQRKIEEIQQELHEDLHSGLYNLGL